MDLWDALELTRPGIVACTGAGGKTSLLLSLAACAYQRHLPVILTATTKMYAHQVEAFRPVIEASFLAGAGTVAAALGQHNYTAWFSRCEGEKVIGLPPEYIDQLAASHSGAYILVEADGAKEKLLKAPGLYEPVIPRRTENAVGVLSLQALGKPLDDSVVHRLQQVCMLLGKQVGAQIEPCDLALIASHEQGLFQYTRGRRTVVLTGWETGMTGYGEKIADYLRISHTSIARCIITSGYGVSMEPVAVFDL